MGKRERERQTKPQPPTMNTNVMNEMSTYQPTNGLFLKNPLAPFVGKAKQYVHNIRFRKQDWLYA